MLVGHAHAVRQIQAGLDSGVTAFLVSGERGIGKTTLVRQVVRERFGAVDHADVLEFSPEKASFGIKPVRELLEAVLDLPSTEFKVALIHHADRFTVQAADALLKTLEEGSGVTRFILTASDPKRVRATIRSRCEQVQLYRLTDLEIEQILINEEISVDPDYVRLARGIPGRAIRAATGSLEAIHQHARRVVSELLKTPLFEMSELLEAISDDLLRDLIAEMMAVAVEMNSRGEDGFNGYCWVLLDELSELHRVVGAPINLRRHLVSALTMVPIRIWKLKKGEN